VRYFERPRRKEARTSQDKSPLFSWFNFSPDTTTITDTSTIIGSNIEEGDGPIERHVLQKVGSYGYQLNRIIDVLSILLERATAEDQLMSDLKTDHSYAPPAGEKARHAVEDFYTMAESADEASKEYKDQAMKVAVERLIKRMQRLRESGDAADKVLYEKFRTQIEEQLPNGGRSHE